MLSNLISQFLYPNPQVSRYLRTWSCAWLRQDWMDKRRRFWRVWKAIHRPMEKRPHARSRYTLSTSRMHFLHLACWIFACFPIVHLFSNSVLPCVLTSKQTWILKCDYEPWSDQYIENISRLVFPSCNTIFEYTETIILNVQLIKADLSEYSSIVHSATEIVRVQGWVS